MRTKKSLKVFDGVPPDFNKLGILRRELSPSITAVLVPQMENPDFVLYPILCALLLKRKVVYGCRCHSP